MTATTFVQFHVNDDSLQAQLERIQSALSPIGMGFLLRGAVKEYLQERIQKRFTSEGDEVSGPWEPLKPATVALREQQGFPGEHPINYRTGEMYDYVAHGPEDFTGTMTVSVLTLPSGSGGSAEALQKLRTAQEGYPSPPTNPRPVLGLGEQDLLTVSAMIGAHIVAYPASAVI